MSIEVQKYSTRLISVHDQPTSIKLDIGGLVTPGTYLVPPISAPDTEFQRCIFTFPNKAPIQYAHLKELNGERYVEIEVFEGKTPQYGQDLVAGLQDEYGRPSSPPLPRALLTVTAAEAANELERQAKFFDVNMGILAIDHEPTISDIKLAKKNNLAFMRFNIEIANKETKMGRNPSSQALAHAWRLHKMGLLNPLPEWASVNPEGNAEVDTQLCPNCNSTWPISASKCLRPGCDTVLNWKLAIERGQILSKDVPKSKRAEAGLEDEPSPAMQAKAQVAKNWAERDKKHEETTTTSTPVVADTR